MTTAGTPQQPARAVECTTCGAQPGERCSIRGTELDGVHAERGLALQRSLEQVLDDTEYGYGSS